MCNIAIIPARGGSKRLPKKNILSFSGKPLIQWTIDVAKSSNCFSNIIVSTDDEDIRKLSLKFGAEVPGLRPKHLATDEATTADVINYTVSILPYREKIKTICLLQPTSPLRVINDIRSAHQLYYAHNCEAVVSVSELEHPIEWTCNISDSRRLINFPQNNLSRSQDYEKKFRLNGSIYLFDAEIIGSFGRELYQKDVVGLEIPKFRSIDIDTIEDFKFAEVTHKYLLKNKIKKWKKQ